MLILIVKKIPRIYKNPAEISFVQIAEIILLQRAYKRHFFLNKEKGWGIFYATASFGYRKKVLFPLFQRQVIPLALHRQISRTDNFICVNQFFQPVGAPANNTCSCEHRGI